jgi:antitoxin YefM
MPHISYTDFRQNLAHYMDKAIDDRSSIVVTRQGSKGNIVILSEQEFESWQETLQLLGNPANASRLLDSLRESEAGLMTEHELIDPPASKNR